MGIEYEHKFSATPADLTAIRSEISGTWTKVLMETTYYDTPDGDLSDARCTLRRRMENDVSVCTLKAPDKGLARREWEILCGDIQQAADYFSRTDCPPEFASWAAKGLEPICGARFTRLISTFSGPGWEAEVALAQCVLLGGGRTEPICEVEVEAKSGTPAQTDRVARDLAARFHLSPLSLSKFARAHALALGGRHEDAL